jgi:acetyl esterase/lipase
VRGGLEKGERWRDAGRLPNKPNTFTDFITVAEYLNKAGYAAPGRIVARGDSAGGLLMGAVANMRPDLFAGIVARVPFVDVLNTMLDETLPLTVSDFSEWGDPIRDVAAYRSIAQYAPYEMSALGPIRTYWSPRDSAISASVLGAGEMGRQAEGAQDQRCMHCARRPHVSRAFRRRRPVRGARRGRADPGLRPRRDRAASAARTHTRRTAPVDGDRSAHSSGARAMSAAGVRPAR